MTVNLFHAPLIIPLHASGRLIFLSGLILLLAMVSIDFTGLSIQCKGLLWVVLLMMLWLECRQQKKARHWRQLQHDAAGNWWLVDQTNQKQPMELGAGSYFSSYLAVIQGRCYDRKVLLWIWRYQYPPSTFRRLSLYLRGSVIE